MLSILIPTYNYNCYSLVKELHTQGCILNVPFEIIVADDLSLEEKKTENRAINNLSNCRYIELKEKLGIARIRNFLGSQAKFPYLIFLDADTMPCDKSFLQRYYINRNEKTVLCGGLRFRKKVPQPNKTLRYIYGTTIEEKNAIKRTKSRYSHFISINFFISKSLFTRFQFNNNFTTYGHEDTLYGIELEKEHIPLIYIDNPIFHEVPDTNNDYIEKTKKSIYNLVQYYDLFQNKVYLLETHRLIKHFGLERIIATFYRLWHRKMEKNLLSQHPNMKLFAFYKLAYLCNLTSDPRRNKLEMS